MATMLHEQREVPIGMFRAGQPLPLLGEAGHVTVGMHGHEQQLITYCCH